MHLQPAYSGRVSGLFPNTESMWSSVLTIPSGKNVDEGVAKAISETILEATEVS